ncbi:nuclear transport factor 2 family protein [Novosphingobium olei]|uniref:SnoaL-like domain-containing protein n=1 Tax=Novosphingobium olei TaxID=2728851 RepID=A0A7Y0BTK1_9SPHN|nr:nuclear transport factor 2 family protein [Novosphingobium olei]NML95656.1 SnoaL-like domain-containing protein [Novosphingobium olei]
MGNGHDNAAAIRDYYRAMGEGDFEHVVSLHDPDVVCWMSGTSLVSGRFQGREPLYAHMGEHVLGPLVTGTEPYVKCSRLVLVDGDYTVGLLHGGLPARDGGRYDQFYLQIFRFEDGLIREIVEFFDTVMVETVLMKNRLEQPRAKPATPFDIVAPGCRSALDREGTVALAQRLTQALADGDWAAARASLAQDVIIRVIGSTPWSGQSDDAGVLERMFETGLSAFRVVAADSASAVVLAKAPAAQKQQYGLIIETDGASVGCLSIFLDTAAAEAGQFGNRMIPATSQAINLPFDVLASFTRSKD